MKMNLGKILIASSLVLVYAGSVLGAVSAEDAKMLGTTLTEIGAEKSGNADGSIPAFTGGLTTPPANYKKGSGVYPDPYLGEKPLFSINSKNMNQYSDKLTEGTKALLKKYPTFRADVYKTHRTATVPKFVQDNTVRNAVRAKTGNDGLSIHNTKYGFPFPIPKNGSEVMWNHLIAYRGTDMELDFSSWLIDSAGVRTLTANTSWTVQFPYYDEKSPTPDIYMKHKTVTTAPARRAGEAAVLIDSVSNWENTRRYWLYLPGQRRVKQGPDFVFDAPLATSGGTTTVDDAMIFNGSMERYNFKLIGKKEVYLPYNAYKMVFMTKAQDLALPKHWNPDDVRFELHRFWVVEATLKPGKRHIYHKRVLYVDEDSWEALASDQYDARGQLYRAQFAPLTQCYDVSIPRTESAVSYDLIGNSYALMYWVGQGNKVVYGRKRPSKFFTPESLAAEGVR